MKTRNHDHIIERIRPQDMTEQDIARVAGQVGNLMVEVQRYYTDDLGLVRIDTDDPPASMGDMLPRFDRIHSSGELSTQRFSFTVARRIERGRAGAAGKPSEVMDGICSMVVLKKSQGCVQDRHTTTELYEFDTRAAERGQGLGRSVLAYALGEVHPEDQLVLDVAESNTNAIDLYRKLGFSFTGQTFAHEIFENSDGTTAQHLEMTSAAATVQEQLS
ncbi:MAG TPA: GNAT family N-acetyltransferase [Candidatus Saccharimonadales bacterium]|nr:GNAT family N-acetyltransferase [Candidatus Saccharimonadales bacterium]